MPTTGLMKKSVKVMGRVTPELNEQINKWAEEMTMQKTAFISLCIRIGFNGVVRAVSPEKLLETDDWKKIVDISHVKEEVKSEKNDACTS